METCQRILDMRESRKTHPAHNLKRDYLIAGLLYCPCGCKWGSRTNTVRASRKDRKGNVRPWADNTQRGVYFCGQRHAELVHPDCARTIGCDKADDYVWEKVCSIIENPDLLLLEAGRFIDELRQNAGTRAADKERLHRELDGLTMERQWVITQARKGAISEADMELQLAALSSQELSLRQELVELSDVVRLAALEGWEIQARAYIAELREGLEMINAVPQSDEERRQLFEAKRQIVRTLVEKVLIEKDRTLRVIFHLDVAMLLQTSLTEQVHQVETCTHTQSSPPPPLPEACA
jgi:hypothetical protein